MDKAKIYLALLKKHHFWVMCGLIFLTSVGVYYVGTGELDDQRKKREGEITAAKNKQQDILKRFQPNELTIVELQKRTYGISAEVEQAWATLYVKQHNRLVWPEDMKQLKERLDQWPDTTPVTVYPDELRRTYHNVMSPPTTEKNRLKKLIQLYQETKVAAPRKGLAERPLSPPKGPLPPPGKQGAEDEMRVGSGLVRWGGVDPDSTGLDNIFIYPWMPRATPPSDLEMRYTQEDLWVYEFILEALAQINKNVDVNRPEKAFLKEIVEFRIGQSASAIAPTTNLMGDLAAIVGAPAALPGQPGAEGGPPGMPPGMGFPPASAEAGRIPGQPGMPPGAPGSATTVNPDEALKPGRYCDLDGKPLSAADIDGKLKEDQYRLMPVYLRLVVNQQKLPALMTALSTAVMPMRIKQVQLYKSDAAAPTAAPIGGGMGPPSGGGSATPLVDPRFSMDVGVEIRGMVHIYQIPNTRAFPHRVAADAAAKANPVPPVANPGAIPAPVVNPAAIPAPVANPGAIPAPVPDPTEPAPVDPAAPAPAGAAPAGAAPAGAAPAGAAPASP